MKYLFLLLLLAPTLSQAQDGPPNNEAEFEEQYRQRIRQDRLNGVYIPKNLDDAMAQLDQLISPESKAKMRQLPEDSVCIYLHNRLGQWMMLNWGFYSGSRLSHYLRSAGVSYPDDMADLLMIAYHRHLNQKPIELKELFPYLKKRRNEILEKEIRQSEIIHQESKAKNRR